MLALVEHTSIEHSIQKGTHLITGFFQRHQALEYGWSIVMLYPIDLHRQSDSLWIISALYWLFKFNIKVHITILWYITFF